MKALEGARGAVKESASGRSSRGHLPPRASNNVPLLLLLDYRERERSSRGVLEPNIAARGFKATPRHRAPPDPPPPPPHPRPIREEHRSRRSRRRRGGGRRRRDGGS